MNKFFFILLLFPSFMIAQQLTIKGNVVDDDSNEPLPGATLFIKGSSIGATTNLDGVFSIASKIGDTLVVSYLGMKTKEVVVLSSPISIRLETEVNKLNEVVVSVGYFDVSKKDLSGSITQINTEQLEKNRTNSIENLLQGQAPRN